MSIPTMQTYNDSKRIIYRLAHSLSETMEYEVTDLISAGNEAWVIARREWKPEYNTRFSTYLHRVCYNAMLSHVKKFGHPVAWEPEYMEESVFPTQDKTYMFKEWVEGLEEDAQYVVELALSDPVGSLGLLPGTANKPRKILSAIKQHLRDIGWSQWRIITTLADLRTQMA